MDVTQISDEVYEKMFKSRNLIFLCVFMLLEVIFLFLFQSYQIDIWGISDWEMKVVWMILGVQIIFELYMILSYRQAMLDLKRGKYNPNVKYRFNTMGRILCLPRSIVLIAVMNLAQYLPIFIVYLLTLFIWYSLKYLEYVSIYKIIIKNDFDNKALQSMIPSLLGGVVLLRICAYFLTNIFPPKKEKYLYYQEERMSLGTISFFISSMLVVVYLLVSVLQATKYFSGKNVEKRRYLLLIGEDRNAYENTYVKWMGNKTTD